VKREDKNARYIMMPAEHLMAEQESRLEIDIAILFLVAIEDCDMS
jgi:hypothetical protein